MIRGRSARRRLPKEERIRLRNEKLAEKENKKKAAIAEQAARKAERLAMEATPACSVVTEILEGGASNFNIPKGAITLPALGWRCRPYQDRFWNYMLGEDGRGDGRKKLAVLNWHRRAGKDSMLLNLIAMLTTRRKGMYWHAFPLLNQGRRAIWEGFMNSSSSRMLDYLPKDLREDSNQQELRINLRTGSTYQIVGGDNPDKLTGSGPIGIGFSEYAQMPEAIWDYTSPILGENDGWAVFISTPRGKNHFHKIYQYAATTPGCFAETLTIEDTYFYEDGVRRPVITQEYLDGLREQGKSEEFIRQEFYCDWNSASDGAVYAKQLTETERDQRICDLLWDPNLPVHTAWDLGYRDNTVILFYQIHPTTECVKIIDAYTNSQQSIVHYCQHVRSKPYRFGSHHAPWDVTNRTLNINSLVDIARENGVNFTRLRKQRVNDGIENVRANFHRLFFDKRRCEELIKALRKYMFAFDEAQEQFGTEPVHDWSSHFADALRYLCLALPPTASSLVPYAIHSLSQRSQPADECPWDVLSPPMEANHAEFF